MPEEMPLLFSFESIKERVRASNLSARQNRNLYPIQEQATLTEIWDYLPCDCNGSCTCRRLGCTHHWRRKPSLAFADILDAFTRMFVDRGGHASLRRSVKDPSGMPTMVRPRDRGALEVLRRMDQGWRRLYGEAIRHNKTLICDRWCNDFLKRQWGFPVRQTTVYRAKEVSILLPDIGVPYDVASRRAILGALKHDVLTYYEMLARLRVVLLGTLQRENATLPEFRRLDAPHEQLPFDSTCVALPRAGFDYGDRYTPQERPISRIIDKCFYRPGSRDVHRCAKKRPCEELWEHTVLPLSGRGRPISWRSSSGGREVSWGTCRFALPDELIYDILHNYFLDDESWHPLGASMTDPMPSGLGEYIEQRFPGLTPRHASAIAAIMLHDGLIVCQGTSPIELRRVDAEQSGTRPQTARDCGHP